MAARMQMDPDEVMVMGGRSAEHWVPRCYAWKIIRRSTESVDDQIAHLVDRLKPVRSMCAPGDVVDPVGDRNGVDRDRSDADVHQAGVSAGREVRRSQLVIDAIRNLSGVE
ncbi:hypothetical protein GCM10023319_07060 [Nocardia iowensis]